MKAFPLSSPLPSLHSPKSLIHAQLRKPNFSKFGPVLLPLLHSRAPSKFKLFSSPVSADHHVPLEAAEGTALASERSEKFDWYSQWYPLMPVCDLDKKVPRALMVLGMDVVVWWDRNENAWKVFDDMCPHRLAPLSEGRIDPAGRLQCVYHGWCFDGSGNCKLIPQAPADGPPVQTSKRACVAAYPTIVHHDMVWFWPNSDPQYKDIIAKEKPPYFPELDDPSFTTVMGSRDLPYGYEVLIENLMDPAHLPYAHFKLGSTQPFKEMRDREGGRPLDFIVKTQGIEGFDADGFGYIQFKAPCFLSYRITTPAGNNKPRKAALIFMSVPVSPGNSRYIWAFPRNFDIWVDKVLPRWMAHMATNIILDSDLYLLHVEERKIKEMGPKNWQKACFLPIKSDALVIGFRNWFSKYGDGKIDWRGKYTDDLPPTPPREQLMDSSCNGAYKALNATETIIKVVSVGLIGIVAATTQGMLSAAARTKLAVLATVCYVTSRWLAHFIYNNFRYHDYSHSSPEKVMLLVRIWKVGLS
ncbi:unnamed protein product [Linum tenue]|uniref:Rieske domain-containing protein n=1 Tax=Linum tenue TaxID=586396 RepID=A0AAV0MF07_9ROSI|nr:unnamed protein product [Linum tenue]